MSKRFRVYLSGFRYCSAVAEVEAPSRDSAIALALDQSGDLEWGVDELEGVSVVRVEQV